MTDALHCIRSLFCSSINCKFHERMFCHTRRSVSGISLPSWLKPDPIYVKRHVLNKMYFLVDEAQPCLRFCTFYNGRETSVSIRDLATYFGEQNVRTDVPDSEARVKNKPMVHVENDP